MTWTYFSRSWGSISIWKFAIFSCKHDNSTNISRIGPKRIPWMYLRSILVKFEDGWPWPIFRDHGGRFQHENSQFLLVNMITQQILVALGPNLLVYDGCISGVSWLSSKMDDLDLFFEVMGLISTCKDDNSTKTILLGHPQPQMYPPVALNQYTLVNRTPKHFIYMLQGPTNILK